jgi:hypothetical protein|tara:strand:+ start:4316 stop:4777 length:462 start_codon:yes stop_codon:yes gene_type:complete
MTSPQDLTNRKYEVVKLKTGSEIVGMVRDTNNGVEITLPMICQLTVQDKLNTLATFYPYAPLSEDPIIMLPVDQVLYRSVMNQQFIPFYDEASSRWLEMVETQSIPLTNQKITAEDVRRDYLNKVMESLIPEDLEMIEEEFDVEDLDPKKTIH